MSEIEEHNSSINMNGTVLRVENLTKHFGKKKVLDNVSIEVMQGQVYGLVGENGAGKTTLIQHILGAYVPEKGSVRVFNLNPVLYPKQVLSRIGYLSETRDMPRWMKVHQLISYTSAFYPSWDMGYAERLIKEFELPINLRVRSLSRGELAKLGLLLALAHRPDLLLLDEPSSGLDPVARLDILSTVVRSVAEEGRTVLFSSHLLDEVERISDYVCMIHKGKIVFSASLEDIRSQFSLVVAKWEKIPQLVEEERVVQVINLGRETRILFRCSEKDAVEVVKAKGGTVIKVMAPELQDIFVGYVKKTKKEGQYEEA
ncbi:MAG: ABC transporter ATP-binding protein [Candidatus Hydrogenedentes bacterium]|nr:ABC transporter ATP-binding protein [Candidatus Hydrogenedentota bacterium]